MYCAVSHQSAEMKVWRCETRKHVAVNYLAGLDLQYRSMKDAELAFPWVEFKPTSGRWTEFEMSSSEWLWRKLSIKELIRQKKNHIYSKVLPLPRAYLITRILTPSKTIAGMFDQEFYRNCTTPRPPIELVQWTPCNAKVTTCCFLKQVNFTVALSKTFVGQGYGVDGDSLEG